MATETKANISPGPIDANGSPVAFSEQESLAWLDGAEVELKNAALCFGQRLKEGCSPHETVEEQKALNDAARHYRFVLDEYRSRFLEANRLL